MIESDQLDNDQKQFLFEKIKDNENYWINGFPGSGKSILMMHTLADIKRREPDAKMLIAYFTHSLRQIYIVGMNELEVNARNISFSTYLQFNKSTDNYDYIFCDEVQDLPASVIKKMKNRCTRLIIAGDPNQSVYTRCPQSGEAVISTDKIAVVSSCTEYPLNTVHRLTKSVISLIGKLLPSMGILKAKENTLKRDVTVRLSEFDNLEEEVKHIAKRALSVTSEGDSAAILLASHDDIITFVNKFCEINEHDKWNVEYNSYGKPNYSSMNFHLNSLKLHYIGNGYGDLYQASKLNKVILMTYHSAKGLDFDGVYLPFLNSHTHISNKTIFMVALSRSKNILELSYIEKMHSFLEQIEDLCTKPTKEIEKKEEFEFDF